MIILNLLFRFVYYIVYTNLNYKHMKKIDRKILDEQQDDKLESRHELKNKLNFISNQFSISRLTDSPSDHHHLNFKQNQQENNEDNKFSNLFPEINQPTLDLMISSTEPRQQPSKITNFNLYVNQNKQYERQYDGQTIRNNHKSYQKKHNNYNQVRDDKKQKNVPHSNFDKQQNNNNYKLIKTLEQKNEELQRQLQQERSQILKLKKKNEKLNSQLSQQRQQNEQNLQKIVHQQKIIQELKSSKQMRQMNTYQSKSTKSKQSMSTISLFQDSIDSFCPELLSPEETVVLLQKLLKKVSKSMKMIKRLSSQGTIHNIIGQIEKY